MDSLTHTVLGACLGEIIAGKKLGKKAMLIGAVANNFPDIDVVTHFFTSPVSSLLVHRGITHSILFCCLFSLGAAWLLPRIFKNSALSFNNCFLLVGSGLFLHIFMDACTSYGTGWFEPFSSYRVSFNTLFIIDPFFLFPLLIATIVLLILKKTSSKRSTVAMSAISLSLLYLLITFLIKIYVNTTVKKNLYEQKISYRDYMVTPTPLNNLLWSITTTNEKDCYVGYYSIFDQKQKIPFTQFPKNDSLLKDLASSKEVLMLKQFSKNYYEIKKTDSSLIFSDLRFGQLGGWYMPQAAFVFNFDIVRKNATISIQQGRIKDFDSKPLKELIKRIKGI